MVNIEHNETRVIPHKLEVLAVGESKPLLFFEEVVLRVTPPGNKPEHEQEIARFLYVTPKENGTDLYWRVRREREKQGWYLHDDMTLEWAHGPYRIRFTESEREGVQIV